MMNERSHLEFLEEKLINNLDFNFLQKIKEKLPYHDVYYLTCLVEILNCFIIENKYFCSYNEMFQSLIDKASALYLSTDISLVLQTNNLSLN
jgi:hypothetical protein